MPRLNLFLLGPPRIESDGKSRLVETRKGVALLTYLALQRACHTRDALAAVFWPEADQSRARAALRRTLCTLKAEIGDAYLEIHRETIGLRINGDILSDIEEFSRCLARWRSHGHPPSDVCSTCMAALTGAAALYRGDFLAGFNLPGSAPFEEWQFFQMTTLQQEFALVLEGLVQGHVARNEYESAIVYARRWLALDPLQEYVHRRLIQLYAWSGQRSAALRQYQECERILKAELDSPPEQVTVSLYNAVKGQRLAPPPEYRSLITTPPSATVPPSSQGLPLLTDETAPTVQAIFVGCERELTHLHDILSQVLAGCGQVILVTAEAGGGKSALLREFARRTLAQSGELIAVAGYCNAQTGPGDPYLPFRQILRLLAGDIEGTWARRILTVEHIYRLLSFTPVAFQCLIGRGTDLINTLLPGQIVLSRSKDFLHQSAIEFEQLRGIAQRQSGLHGREQSDLVEQYAGLMQTLAQHRPLLIIVDDLHWADRASLNLFFHLGRQLATSRILLVGAYRSDDVALGISQGASTKRHPLESVVNELKRCYGNIILALDHAHGRDFVEAIVDAQPNQLGPTFRETLFRHTQGQPLFTVELLRAMRERGDLVQDENGYWIQSETLVWGKLPAQVEAVIQERIERLPEQCHQILSIASVEGETFTAQVVANILGVDIRILLEQLRTLEKRHRLVRRGPEISVGQQLLTRYDFTHILFQQHLYQGLSVGERQLIHSAVARLLTELYAGKIDDIKRQLAHHFRAAGNADKAAGGLLAIDQEGLI